MRLRNQLSLAALGAVLTLGLAGCALFKGSGQQTTMRNVGDAPAASGIIESSRTDEGNTMFAVKVENLAEAHRVVDGTRTYVVWLRPLDAEGPAQNIGVLRPDANLKGTISGITPYTNFEVFVTAEQFRTPDAPSDNRVLAGQVYRGT